jgi:hypothetical protein
LSVCWWRSTNELGDGWDVDLLNLPFRHLVARAEKLSLGDKLSSLPRPACVFARM